MTRDIHIRRMLKYFKMRYFMDRDGLTLHLIDGSVQSLSTVYSPCPL